jgi:putative Holliday junction resolvase
MEIFKRIMGIDYGSKRIGIAISDPLNIIAQGVGVIENNNKKFDEIEKLVAKNNRLVVLAANSFWDNSNVS